MLGIVLGVGDGVEIKTRFLASGMWWEEHAVE